MKNYINRLITLKDIIKKNNDLDKLKCFVFDEDLITIYENTLNPDFQKIKENTNNIWLETSYRNNISNCNLEKMIHTIKNKIDKNIFEKNILRIYND